MAEAAAVEQPIRKLQQMIGYVMKIPGLLGFIASTAVTHRTEIYRDRDNPGIDRVLSTFLRRESSDEDIAPVQIADRALVVAAELADRYITNRFLPDKAIDLVDEACSNLQVRGREGRERATDVCF